MKIYGLDFTSAPSRRKPITCAQCRLNDGTLHLEAFGSLETFTAFERFLAQPGPWVAGIDFPFGQPRQLVENLGWPQTWAGYVRHLSGMSKREFDALLRDYRAGRPKGDKQHLRRTDELAGSRSPMMMYGVPVGKMFFEGAPRLLASGACILPCHSGDDTRIIVEAYPGLVARRWIGNASYKSDTKRKQTLDKRYAREGILRGLGSPEAEQYYGFTIHFAARAHQFIQDGSGDQLDALLCAVQAGWAYSQPAENFAIPAACDPLEGWIVDPLLLHLLGGDSAAGNPDHEIPLAQTKGL
jgi:hypothetical protein